MADAMILRGPDESGVFIDGNIGLAHRRLSIIDLKTGQQPMYSADRQCVIVFNGEIYNFQRIREDMQREGVSFATTSDTEVLLNGYIHYGIDKILSLVDGMFAFAIYDKCKRKVFVARDRYGEKPLYYIPKDDSFTFASELKAFGSAIKKDEIDLEGLNLYLSLNYIPAPYTIYKGVRKLESGTYLEVAEDDRYVQHCYYDLIDETNAPDKNLTYEDAKKQLRELMFDAVKLRMISDVPMGAFLSGGLDSSVVCCIMSQLSNQPINTFSIGFEQKEYDETDRALAVSKHIHSNHTQFRLKFNDVLKELDDIILYYDEPFADSSQLPTYVVAKLAREKVKVVLTGDTADELFGGYPKYINWGYLRKFAALPNGVLDAIKWGVNLVPSNKRISYLVRNANRFLEYSKMSDCDAYFSSCTGGKDDAHRVKLLREGLYKDVKTIFHDRYQRFEKKGLTSFQKVSVWDIQTQLEGDMIPKVDRACMHVSLENRTPFLDKRIVRFATNLPDEYKIKGKDMKHILWDTFADILPMEILRLPKKGFSVPVDYWLKHELKDEFERLTSREIIEKQGLFNYEYIHKMYSDHINGLINNKSYLWNVFVFQKWYIRNI
jgi:asparagine synthase (glutamine-hydrolysing)